MRIGLFLPTTNNGYLYSAAAPQFAPSYALNKEATLAAEAVGLSFALSMVKHRGYGGEMGFWDQSLESLAMMVRSSRRPRPSSCGPRSEPPRCTRRWRRRRPRCSTRPAVDGSG